MSKVFYGYLYHHSKNAICLLVMEEKISLKALEDYSDDFASKVTASFFSSKEKITGPEILKLIEVHQVNLFVIRELLQVWRLEGQKLRSPYFDYSAKPITEALTKFQNLLSNHISISRENFQPLLKKAVSQTLYLILDPYDFYSDTLDAQGNLLKVEDLKVHVRYIRINKTPLEKLLQELEEKKLSTIGGNEAFAQLDHILEEVNFTPEDIDGYVSQFSKILPLALQKLYERKSNTPKAAEATSKMPMAISKPVLSEPVKPPAAQIPLYDQPGKISIAENFQKKKKIKDSLTINQKFMFTKILFNGDFELFSTAVDQLDELTSLSEAKSYLDNNHGEWNPESEEYQEFMEMIERRFA